MAKIKIFELKNLINEQTKSNIESKDIQDYLEKSLGVKKTHSSNLEDNEVSVLKNHFIPQAAKPAAPTPAFRPAQNAGQVSARPAADQRSNNDPRQSAEQRPSGAAGNRHPEAGQRPSALAGNRSMGAGQATGQRPDSVQRPAGQGTPRPEAGQRQEAVQRPAGQGYQGLSGGQRPDSGRIPAGQGAARPEAGQRQEANQRTAGQVHQGLSGSQRPEGGQRTAGQAGMRSSGDSGQKPIMGYQTSQGNYHSGQRPIFDEPGRTPAGQRPEGGQRPAGQGHQGLSGGQRPEAVQRTAGQAGIRPGNEGGQRTERTETVHRTVGQNNQGYQGGYQGSQRQEGQQSGMQQRTSGQSGQGYRGAQRTEAGQRPDTVQRTAGQNGMRQGGYGQGYQGGQRSTGSETAQRTGNQGYRQNTSGQGYQRPDGQGRPSGNDQGYQRSSQGNYRQGNQGNSNSMNQNRQGGNQGGNERPQRSGYSQGNNRPAGERGQGGNRPGGYQGGQRPQGQGNNNYSRQGSGSGQRSAGGYGFRGMDDFKKDEDDKPSFNRSGQGAKRGPGGQRGSERKNFDQQILDQKVAEKNDFSNKRNRDRINKEKNYKEKNLIDKEERDLEGNIIKKILPAKKGQFIQPKPVVENKADEIKTITLPEVLTIKELADKMKMPSSTLVKKLFLAGKMVSINQEITFEEAEEIALEYEIIAEKEVKINEVEELLKETEEDTSLLVKRPPVVCVMGHVDHGKTSLLDAIRETNVTSREAGGITQHIGAYVVEINGEKITFLDTPGHEAFTSMRMRGAKSTDIAILVIAADDGVMPQTVEAINHAKAAGVQIIVAVNKIDKPSANVERVKQELTEYELVAEDWGGDTIFVPVSAHTKEGIDRLLEMILLTAEMMELKANPKRNARGIVIEAELDKGRGPVATILVQKGTLNVGDNIAVGASFGKVRAMMDDKGRRVKEATPSTPVEILGLNEVPDAGETFLATDNEKEARTISEAFIKQSKEKLIADTKAKLSLDGLFSRIKAGNIKEFNLIIKADVQGSVEAMKQSLLKLSNDEVAVRIIHGGVGAINESDVILASASNAIIIGFNVRPDNAAKETSERENVEVKLYRVIYNAIDDIEAAMKGMLDPVYEERIIGHADIRQTFKASGVGTIAGSYVLDGKIQRGCKARIYRDNALIYEGNLASLKRFQDDVKEVATGYECGLVFEKFNDVKEGDKVELYIMAEVPR